MSKEKKTTSSLSLDELRTKGSEIEGQLFKLRMQKTTGQLANTALIRVTRKELARIRTYETQKQRAASASGAKGK